MQFTWKTSYELGEAATDREHKELFILANDIVSSTSKDELIRLVMELCRLTRIHFKHEEQHMIDRRYPQYNEHADIHNKMLASLTSKSADIENGHWQKDSVTEFMEMWTTHINTSDKQFFNHLSQIK